MIQVCRIDRCRLQLAVAISLVLAGTAISAQNRQGALGGVPGVPPPAGQVVLHTAEVPRIRVVPIAHGLSHPWGMAFRRNGDILVTERDTGTLRVIRDGLAQEERIVVIGVQRAVPGRAVTPEECAACLACIS